MCRLVIGIENAHQMEWGWMRGERAESKRVMEHHLSANPYGRMHGTIF
jgi:hypothetical protein